MLGARTLYKEDAGFILRAPQFLQSCQRNKESGALPVLDDSRDMPVVLENTKSLSRLNLFCFRGNVVYKYVVRAFQIVPLKKDKSARDSSKALLLNSVNEFHARRVKKEEHGRHGLHVLQFGKLVADLDGHRSCAESQKERRVRRLQHDVRPDAFDALGGFGHQAAGPPAEPHYQPH